METPNNMIPTEPVVSNLVPAPAISKIGKIALILGILGAIVYCGVMTIFFLIGFTGIGPAPRTTGDIILTIISYLGILLDVVGGVLGVVSLVRKENRTFGIIAIVICVLMLCTCSTLNTIGAFFIPPS